MLEVMLKEILSQVKLRTIAEYESDSKHPHSGVRMVRKMRDGYEAESLYFAAETDHAPLLIEVYGGGYVGGNVYKQAALCERYRNTLSVNAAALSYRYAPDYRHPTAIHDLYDALCAMIDDPALSFDRSNIILEGHSAGAHLVLTTVLYAQTQPRKLPVRAMILDYPVVDTRRKVLKDLPLVDNAGSSKAVDDLVLEMMCQGYIGKDSDAEQPLASPILASDEALRALPPIYINTCEYDRLKYTGRAFYERLISAGARAQIHETPGAIHGYVETCSNGSIKDNPEYSQEVKDLQYRLYDQTFEELCAYVQSQIRKQG